jgi:nitronate monooxygenase
VNEDWFDVVRTVNGGGLENSPEIAPNCATRVRTTRMNALLKRLGIQHPIVQAPMAGGSDTPALAAAVSNAGGLGSLGVSYLTPDQIAESMRQVRARTDRPFNTNLFARAPESGPQIDPRPMLALLAEIHEAFGLPAPVLPVLPADPFPDQFQAVLEALPAVFSFTFGIPRREAIALLRAAGIAVLGTATTVAEAHLLAEAGVDAIVAQGCEAGAHRGTFAGPFEDAMIPTLDLLQGIRRVVDTPVISSGGLMDGKEVAAAMALGASAAQLGTAFLTCPESGAPEAHKRAILMAREDTTVVTRAFSGRPARGLANAFIAKLVGKEHAILPYPLQNALTRVMRAAAAKRGDSRFLSLWAGKGVARARSMPAAELVECLVNEMNR